VRPSRIKTGQCKDCGCAIHKKSARCRACNMKITTTFSVSNKPMFAVGMTGAERMTRWRAINPELAKFRSNQWKAKQRKKVATYKASIGCAKCGIKDHRVLDLHHRNGEDKDMAVSAMLSKKSWDAVKAEMEKCEVLCANCHRIAHYEQSGMADSVDIAFAKATARVDRRQ